MDFSKMDFKKIVDMSELKKSLTRLENIAALGLVVFFFFPWASLGPFSVNGFGAAGEYAILFLVPVLGILILAMRPICQIPAVLKGIKFAAGALPILGFISAVADGGLNFLGIGAYLTFLAAIAIILGTLNVVQLPNALPAVDEPDAEESSKES